MRSKFLTTKLSSKSRVAPKAFTEKGLYMLATILKSKRAVAATFAIIETFVKVRGLKRELVELHKEGDKRKQADKMRHFGETLADIVMPDLETVETESSLELNFFIGKIKHTVRRIRKVEPKKGVVERLRANAPRDYRPDAAVFLAAAECDGCGGDLGGDERSHARAPAR